MEPSPAPALLLTKIASDANAILSVATRSRRAAQRVETLSGLTAALKAAVGSGHRRFVMRSFTERGAGLVRGRRSVTLSLSEWSARKSPWRR